VPSHWNCSELI